MGKKKQMCEQVDFAVPEDYRVKIKESKKKVIGEYEGDSDTNHCWSPRKNHQEPKKETEVSKKIQRRIETAQTTALLTLARILRRVLQS